MAFNLKVWQGGAELREIYWGFFWEKGRYSSCIFSGGNESREQEGEGTACLHAWRVYAGAYGANEKKMSQREEVEVLLVAVGQWSFRA